MAGSSFKYHGKVQFSGRLCYAEKKKSGKLRFYLEKPDLGSSCRFTRRFGSDWLIRIRCQSDIHPARLHEFFMRPFIIFGRVYRAFYARLVCCVALIFGVHNTDISFASKEHTVFLAAVNEIYENGVLRTLPETPRRLCLDSLLKWHNPMDLNSNQVRPHSLFGNFVTYMKECVDDGKVGSADTSWPIELDSRTDFEDEADFRGA